VTRPESPPPFDCVLGAWQAHEAELLGLLRHQLPDEPSAEDMLQEVFLRAMQRGACFCRIEFLRAWLYRGGRCRLPSRLDEQVARDTGLAVTVERVEDFPAIMSYGVKSTPGVVVDGTVVHAGGVPGRDKVERWLTS
jgi:hypothetical protein